MKKNLILIGGGGHCKSCIDVIEMESKYTIAGIVDVKEKLHQKILGYEVIGTDQDVRSLVKDYDEFLITVGQIKEFKERKRLYERLRDLNAKFPVIISPLAHVSKHAVVGEGTIVMHNAIVNAGARVGRNCIINSKALIEHDVHIGDHCHISTAAILNGGVKVGSGTFIGSNTVSRESIVIGEKAVIGCNAKIMKNIPDAFLLK